jgi:hypothetical protein
VIRPVVEEPEPASALLPARRPDQSSLLGAIGAKGGRANIMKATLRVTVWSALAKGLTAGIGALIFQGSLKQVSQLAPIPELAPDCERKPEHEGSGCTMFPIPGKTSGQIYRDRRQEHDVTL